MSRVASAGLLLGLVTVFLTVGVPRRLAGDVGTVRSPGEVTIRRLCRDHGGTPMQGGCTVRYGRQAYLMDAITRDGFDEDTARYQRQGCEEAQRTLTARGRRQAFIYHPVTGVCEHRL